VVSHTDDPAHGFGLTHAVVDAFFAAGVDVLTGGNHSWDAPAADEVLARPNVLRPLNIDATLAGKGVARLRVDDRQIVVVNLITKEAAQPHAIAHPPLDAFETLTFEPDDCIIVDFHAERQRDKRTMGHALDGRVAAVVGTHTHEATLHCEVLPNGTLFCADAGMNGPSGGVLGMAAESFVAYWRSGVMPPFRLADGPIQIGAVLLDVNVDGPSIRRFLPED
jgi:metallophosphoesterase (TIGR00282 family)